MIFFIRYLALLIWILLPVDSLGPGYIYTLAGNELQFSVDFIIASFNFQNNYLIFFYHIIIGSGTGLFSGDGSAAINANLGTCQGIAIDTASNFYVGGFSSNTIRKITYGSQIIVTIAGKIRIKCYEQYL